jgi:hypothetical protein
LNERYADDEGFGSLVRERNKARVERRDGRMHRPVRGHRPRSLGGDLAGLRIGRSDRRARRAERQALDQHHQLAGQSAPAAVAAAAAGERDQPALAVADKPALRGAKRRTGVARRRDKRHGILDVRGDHRPAARGIGADALVKLATPSVARASTRPPTASC